MLARHETRRGRCAWYVLGGCSVVGAAMVAASCIQNPEYSDIPPIDCDQGTRVEFDGVSYCLYCLAETFCPPGAPYRLEMASGVICTSVQMLEPQVTGTVRARLDRRCVFAHDAGAPDGAQ